ncbi:prolyl oligopeptidase family serine peptidase [soil metagenome]
MVALLALLAPVSGVAIEPIPRRLPPAGQAPGDAVAADLHARLIALQERAGQHGDEALLPDAEIYLKAVRLALEFDEFYKDGDPEKAGRALDEAERRLGAVAGGQAPWAEASGKVVRGYRSAIDGSAQPYGLEIPAGLALSDPVPLYVWLHGRGDADTDLHFIGDRESKSWPFETLLADGIVLHPFGRQCLGFKSAGEIDVLDAIAHVSAHYPIDPDRIALMGFSMGGAGAWHLGAHFADRWAVVHAGAGFVDVARYQNLAQDAYPSAVEQALWGLYDVPDYARNLLNLPVIAYSGGDDKQKDAADFMAETLAGHGFTLPHKIGPGTGHKYHDETIQEVAAFVRESVATGRDPAPQTIHWQTRTLRYPGFRWLRAEGLGTHWEEARLDATLDGATLAITTRNVTRLRLDRPLPAGTRIRFDGQPVRDLNRALDAPSEWAVGEGGEWELAGATGSGIRKRPGLQGPIDDAFLTPFLVVEPGGSTPSAPELDAWVDFELAHLKERWRGVFRGDLRVKTDSEVTREDFEKYAVVLFGTPESNRLIAKALEGSPLRWGDGELALGGEGFDAASCVPLMVFPGPVDRSNYIVLNSGPTFREAHDRTNSLQNPKLGDWAVIDVRGEAPSAERPGKIVGQGFFDERWQPRR